MGAVAPPSLLASSLLRQVPGGAGRGAEGGHGRGGEERGAGRARRGEGAGAGAWVLGSSGAPGLAAPGGVRLFAGSPCWPGLGVRRGQGVAERERSCWRLLKCCSERVLAGVK